MMANQRRVGNGVVAWCVFLFLVLGALGGIGFMGWFWFVEQARGRQALDWPTVDGVFERNATRGARGEGRHVAYRYVVDGRTYHGYREGFAYKQGPRLEVGAPVKVYVQPGDPTMAVLFPGESPARWPFGSGAIIVAVCLLFAFAYRPWPGAVVGETFLGWAGCLAASAAALIAAWGIVLWCVELQRGFASRSWPTADGVFEVNGTSAGSKSRRSRIKSVYHYYVGGQRYEGSRKAFGWRRPSRRSRRAARSRCTSGRATPPMAVIFPGPTNNFLLPLAALAFLVVFGGVAWLACPWTD